MPKPPKHVTPKEVAHARRGLPDEEAPLVGAAPPVVAEPPKPEPPEPTPAPVPAPPPAIPAPNRLVGRTGQFFESWDDVTPEAAVVTEMPNEEQFVATTVYVYGKRDLAARREHSVAIVTRAGAPWVPRTGRRFVPHS